jgi:hypothetical protein
MPAAPGGVENKCRLALVQQHLPGRGVRRLTRDRRRRPHDLAVGGVAQVKAFAAMPIPVGDRKRPCRNRESFLRRITSSGLPLPCQNLRDVFVYCDPLNSRLAFGQGASEPQEVGSIYR